MNWKMCTRLKFSDEVGFLDKVNPLARLHSYPFPGGQWNHIHNHNTHHNTARLKPLRLRLRIRISRVATSRPAGSAVDPQAQIQGQYLNAQVRTSREVMLSPAGGVASPQAQIQVQHPSVEGKLSFPILVAELPRHKAQIPDLHLSVEQTTGVPVSMEDILPSKATKDAVNEKGGNY
jgi:hypothetical protein